MQRVLVTGGAGYVGAPVCEELIRRGQTVRVLDALIHGQDDVADWLERLGAEVFRDDVRDEAARRAALVGVDVIVHLAAIVGDPACARAPGLSATVNVEATCALIRDASAAGIRRLVFASTCSNYGRAADPTRTLAEDAVLAPISLYAEQKVTVERELLIGSAPGVPATCLRFATVYGVAPRMRFDLTVNEFTRDLWAGRELQIFGEQFWRPYVHVRDVARAVALVLEAPDDAVAGEVFNVGATAENYRKLDLVDALSAHLDTRGVSFVHRDEDPRDYKVSFEKIRGALGFAPRLTVNDGIREVLEALENGAFRDPFDIRHRNIP